MSVSLSEFREELEALCKGVDFSLLCVLVLYFAAFACHAQSVSIGRIKGAVENARRSHLTSISIPLPLMQQQSISSLDEELRSRYAIMVQPVARVSTLSPDGNSIFSWYKLRTIRKLSHATLDKHEDEAVLVKHLPDLPRQLLPVAQDEVIVSFVGGQLTIDGVQVTYGSSKADLELHKTYLIFVGSFVFNDGTKSTTGFGPINNWSSVFSVGANGDTLTPLIVLDNAIIPSLVSKEFHGRLSEVMRRVPEVKP
jgi:hypothetical protein